ncbi:glycine/betaine ABC transporter permease [Modestobacter caceresii]|uniref:Glycine/betaine ABC transporter permease n=1 Tax=Modestobacter caceresii TaxID=1522368 RepID=A0A098Y262_9ACTN|nr:BCCT family transporter [Modestobacter caceresii]KGH44998.1 glycine/betaine ABC transporter permease [Modestobacter caceresii]
MEHPGPEQVSPPSSPSAGPTGGPPTGAASTAAREPTAPPQTDRVVFGVSLALVVAFALWGALASDSLSTAVSAAFGTVITNAGWVFVVTSSGFVALAGFLALSRYGRIRLGKDDERPEFSTGSWISMLFAAGMGIGLLFWGVAEPLSHLAAAPLGLEEGGTPEAARLGLQYTIFHWGLHPWAMYAVMAMALAYGVFRKGRPSLVSSAVVPLVNEKRTGVRRAVDILAIFTTVFGAATSLGLGALQVNSGLAANYGVPRNNGVAVAIIAGLALLYVLSAVSGVHKGIKLISNTNVVLAALLVAFIFVLGPTTHVLNTITDATGDYLTALPAMSLASGVWGGQEWLAGWTLFYWAWWMSWTPFVGTFIARISRGRTIRQFVTFVMIIPTMVSIVWFGVLGGTATHLELTDQAELSQALLDDGTEGALFALLGEFPVVTLTVLLVMVLITLFFVSSADSASMVLGMLSQRGTTSPARAVVILWGMCIAAVAAALTLAGGLQVIQSATILVATPFVVVLIAICVNLVRELRQEPYTSTLDPQVRRAVVAHLHDMPHPNGAGPTSPGVPVVTDPDREPAGQQ